MTREEAIYILKNNAWLGTDEMVKAIEMAIETLSAAEPKTGEWIEVEVFHEVYDIEGVKSWGSEMQCDQCGFRFTAIEGRMAQYNFCPNCGAKMYKDGEDE